MIDLLQRLKGWNERRKYREGFVKVDTEIAHEVVAEHEESWDIEIWWMHKYKHKDTGEEYWDKVHHKDLGETHTTFEDPTDKDMSWNELFGSFTSHPMKRFKPLGLQ